MASLERDVPDRDAARIPPDIRAALSADQIARLTALLPAPRRHAAAWRASSRLFGRRFYLAVLTGREGRTPRRVRADRQAMSFGQLVFRIFAVAFWITAVCLVAVLAGIVAIYLVKSYLGIDLMDGPSPLHRFFFN